ncbi:MAG: flippase-like domain-containing protein [Anaerolineales bacterium]|nr:flippase-like domain-containing protein [Anaerolineales bacterium]
MEPQQTEKRSPNWNMIIRVGGTILALGLMVYLLSQQDWDEIREAVGNIEIWRFVAAVFLIFCSRFFYIARWHMLLRSSDIPVSFGESTRLTFAGLFASNFLPTTVGGDVVRLAGCVQKGFDGVFSAASLLMDRLVGMAGMALILPFGIVPLLGSETTLQTWQPEIRFVAALPAVLGKWVKTAQEKALELLRHIWEAVILWKDQPQGVLAAFSFTCMHMVSIVLCFYLLLAGMGEEISPFLVAGLWSVVYFVTLLPISINGLGVQEASFYSLFVNLGGVSPESALTLAFVYRLIMMFASLPGALFVSSLLPNARKRATKAPASEEESM